MQHPGSGWVPSQASDSVKLARGYIYKSQEDWAMAMTTPSKDEPTSSKQANREAEQSFSF